MRNSAKWTACGLIVLAVTSGRVASAQSAAGALYDHVREQETRVSMSPGASVGDFRFVVERYWRIVRRYPVSGYADNALFQAANLSMEAFRRFSEERDKTRAVQLMQWLKEQYPRSSLATRGWGQVEQVAAPPTQASQPPAELAAPIPARALELTMIRAVRREILPEAVRITLEMDREVPFYQESLAGPARLFFDLKGTRAVSTLQDATLRYDADVVREIRLGRHPNSTTRVVIDLEHVKRYSVFTLYQPYRIVIDCEREQLVTPPLTQVAAVAKPVAEPVAAAPTIALPFPVAAREPVPPPPVATPAGPAVVSARPVLSTPAAPSLHPLPDSPLSKPASPKPVPPAVNSGGKFSVARQLGLGASRIVIDPGHGGHDPGATAFAVSEAELVLDVSLRLERLLQEQGIDVILTRRTNDFLGLDERTDIANREAADMFLSIHANASASASARGIETYFLNFALNRQAEVVAARENAASGKTMSSLPDIIKAITLNSKLNESRDFATAVQRSLVRGLAPSNASLRDLGVKQAPFMVLIGASMPSVLAEISFVTNRQEARLLKSPGYRDKIAESLLAGVLKYQQSLKKVQSVNLN
jgi:N-acetylmuramoyl-L-alanine amidase